MTEIKTRVKLPATAAAGEVVTIRALIAHRMESGFRKGADGQLVPRQIINRFSCDLNGVNVIDVALDTAISANPYFEFQARIDAAGIFNFTWYDDDSAVYSETAQIAIR